MVAMAVKVTVAVCFFWPLLMAMELGLANSVLWVLPLLLFSGWFPGNY